MLEKINRILVPVGFDSFSKEELVTAENLAKLHGAEIHIFHAYEDVFKVLSMRTLDLDMEQIEETVQQEVEAELDKLSKSVAFSTPVVLAIRKGDTADQILEYVEEAGIDLIVMATHGRAGLESFFLGSVTQKIVRYATCPVLTLRIQNPLGVDRK